jgi:outer membrane immunogenic protein
MGKFMKKLLIILGAVAALTAPAGAADLPARTYTKAPPPVAIAVYDWSGFYAGINGGWGTSHKCWDLHAVALGTPWPTTVSEGCHDASGGTVGGQIGYRWQRSSWVFGLEAQGNWANFTGSNLSTFWFPALNDQTKIDAFGLFTGQVGYAVNNVLLYVKGGAAVMRDKYSGFASVGSRSGSFAAGALTDTASETRWGGTVGVGLEYGFAPNWSFAFEYDHLFMGSRDVTFIITPGGGFASIGVGQISRIDRISQDADIITARINYRFGGPVVAKY